MSASGTDLRSKTPKMSTNCPRSFAKSPPRGRNASHSKGVGRWRKCMPIRCRSRLEVRPAASLCASVGRSGPRACGTTGPASPEAGQCGSTFGIRFPPHQRIRGLAASGSPPRIRFKCERAAGASTARFVVPASQRRFLGRVRQRRTFEVRGSGFRGSDLNPSTCRRTPRNEASRTWLSAPLRNGL